MKKYDFRVRFQEKLPGAWDPLGVLPEIVLFFLKSYFSSNISYVHELILSAGRNNHLHEEKEVLDHKVQSLMDLILTS